jgi:hypothetical protein
MSGHVSALRKLLLAVKRYGRNSIHIYDEMKCARGEPFQLSDSEWTNFSHLRYHGLAQHADKYNPKSGRWLITLNGGRFLRGEIAIPSKVAIRRGRVVGHSPEKVIYAEFVGKHPEFRYLPEFDPEHPERAHAAVAKPAQLFA